MKGFLRFVFKDGSKNDLQIHQFQSIKTPSPEFIHLDRLPSGAWALTINEQGAKMLPILDHVEVLNDETGV